MATDKPLNYDEHQERFTELKCKNPDLSLKQYCEDNGLKFGTAKRYIKTTKKGVTAKKVQKKPNYKQDWGELYKQYLTACLTNPNLKISEFAKSIDMQPRSLSNGFRAVRNNQVFSHLQKRVETAKNVGTAKPKPKPKSNKIPVSRASSLKKLAGANKQANDILDKNIQYKQMDGRDEKGKFTYGHKHSTIHGGYAKLAGLDDESFLIATEIDPLSLVNELAAARSQYISMLNYIRLGRELLEARYQTGDPVIDSEGKEVPLEKELMKLQFGTADKLRSLEISISSMVMTISKVTKEQTLTMLKSREDVALTKGEILTIQKEIFDQRTINEWTASETARQLEIAGVPIPDFLMMEARKEVSDYVPPIDDNGITDEELEQLSQEYEEEQRQKVEEWLPDRKNEIRELFDYMDKVDAGEIIPGADDESEPQDLQDNMEQAFADIEKFEQLDDEENN